MGLCLGRNRLRLGNIRSSKMSPKIDVTTAVWAEILASLAEFSCKGTAPPVGGLGIGTLFCGSASATVGRFSS